MTLSEAVKSKTKIQQQEILFLLFSLAFGIDITISYIQLPQIGNIRNILLSIIVSIIFFKRRRSIPNLFLERDILKWTIVLVFSFLTFSLINLHFSINQLKPIFGLSLIYISFFCLKKTEEVIQCWKYPLLFITLSTVIGLFQYFNFDFFWQIRENLGGLTDQALVGEFQLRNRPFGINYWAIHLSYGIAMAYPLMIYFAHKKQHTFWKIVLTLNTIFIMISGVRSLILSAITTYVLLAIYFLLKKNIISKKLLITFVTALIFTIPIFLIFLYQDPSALSRIPLLINGIVALFYYPLGLIGPWGTADAAQFFYNLIPHGPEIESIFHQSPHNYFITFATDHGGILGLLLACWTIFECYKVIFKSNFYDNNFKFCLLLSLISYHVTTLFHNGGGLMGHQLFFFYVANILALKRMNQSEDFFQGLLPN